MQHLIQLDTSQLDRWDDVVLNPAVNVVEHLMAGTLPAVKVNHTFWEQQSESLQCGGRVTCRRNKKFVCDVCKKVIMGEEQWHDHLQGRVHKRHVEGLKKKKAAEAYFASKKKEKESSHLSSSFSSYFVCSHISRPLSPQMEQGVVEEIRLLVRT